MRKNACRKNPSSWTEGCAKDRKGWWSDDLRAPEKNGIPPRQAVKNLEGKEVKWVEQTTSLHDAGTITREKRPRGTIVQKKSQRGKKKRSG